MLFASIFLGLPEKPARPRHVGCCRHDGLVPKNHNGALAAAPELTRHRRSDAAAARQLTTVERGMRVLTGIGLGENMQKNAGKPKAKCKNCEGKGLVKQGDKKMKCQRCGGTGFKS